jgi:hypothetical protein
MKRILFFLILFCLQKALHAQQPYIYTIKADSVKITNTCDTAELIIENHTQNVPGFLFNKGRGRTEFKRISQLDDTSVVIGGDTIHLGRGSRNFANADLTFTGNRTHNGVFQYLNLNDFGGIYIKTGTTDRLYTGEFILDTLEGFRLGFNNGYQSDPNTATLSVAPWGLYYELLNGNVTSTLNLSSNGFSFDRSSTNNYSNLFFNDMGATWSYGWTDSGYATGFRIEPGEIGSLMVMDGCSKFGLRYAQKYTKGFMDDLWIPDLGGVKKVIADSMATVRFKRRAVVNTGIVADPTDYLIAFTSLTAARTVTLPLAGGMTNHVYVIKDESGAAATYNITINAAGGGTIDGTSSKVINTNYGVIEVYSNGSQYFTK